MKDTALSRVQRMKIQRRQGEQRIKRKASTCGALESTANRKSSGVQRIGSTRRHLEEAPSRVQRRHLEEAPSRVQRVELSAVESTAQASGRSAVESTARRT
jgi:hypothetical protein